MSTLHTLGSLIVSDILDDGRLGLVTDNAYTYIIVGANRNMTHENGQRLAHCWNHHNELLAALLLCNQRLLARMHTDSGDDCEAYSAACAAIANATRGAAA